MSDDALQITIGADASGLLAGVQIAKAQIAGLQTQMRALANDMIATGRAADADLKMKLGGLAGTSQAFKSQLADLEKALGGAAAGGHGAGAGLGFYTRELHALADEFTSGRIRQGEGTLANLILTFVQSNTALIPYVASAAALAATFGYLGYRAYEAQQAINNIRLDAAVSGFQLSGDQAARLRDTIKQLADVGDSDAEKIAKPFAQLGMVGATVAELLAPIMKNLAQQMGGDVAKAAQEVARRFVDLDGAGKQFVNTARGVTEAEKEHFSQLVATGYRTQAFALLIDLTSRSLVSLKDNHKIAAAAAIDQAAALQDAALAGGDMRASQAHAGEAVADATGKITAESAQLSALRSQLLAASTAAETFSSAMQTAMKVDTVAAGIKATQDEITRLEAGLAVASDHITAATAEMGRALDMAKDKLKQLKQQQADPGGMGRDLIQQDQDALKHFDDTSRQTEQARLAGHIAMLKGMLASDQLNAQQRFKLQQDLESSEHQLYAQQAKAGEKAAKDVLGAARQANQEQIQLSEEAARKKVKGYDDDLSHQRVTIVGYLAETKAALNEEIASIQAA